MSKTTRHIGFCCVCAKDFKVRGNKLVHHGYKRPGHGFIVGDCMGALETPHELSPELAKKYQGMIRRAIKSILKGAVEHSVRTEITLTKREWDREAKKWADNSYTITSESCEWDFNFRRIERSIKQNYAAHNAELDRITELVDTWELKTLTTREEDKAVKQDAKKVREAKKVQAKQDKVNTQAAKYQKRIDSALKTKNSNTLAEIWESCQSKFRDIDSSLTKAECITLLERDEVWAAFGLASMTKSLWNTPGDDKEPLSLMKNRMDRIKSHFYTYGGPDRDGREQRRLTSMSLEWPESLGGENKKGTKTLADLKTRLAKLVS